MPRLVTDHPLAPPEWGCDLPEGQLLVLGRKSGSPVCVAWDRLVSGTHAELTWSNGALLVRRLETAKNVIFHEGEPVVECRVPVGGRFVIGDSLFRVVDDRAVPPTPSGPSDSPVEEVTFPRHALRHIRYRDADRRIEVLSRLPAVLGRVDADDQLLPRLVNVLLAGVAHAEAAAVVELTPQGTPRMLAWDRRRETAGAFRPSSRLILESLGRRGASVLHVWESVDASLEFTATQDFDWAFCTPVPHGPVPVDDATDPPSEHADTGARGTSEATIGEPPRAVPTTDIEPRERRGLYLAGKFDQLSATPRSGRGDDGPLQADVKFTELVAEFVGAARRLRVLERTQAGLRQFFPPVVVEALGRGDEAALLAPRETEVTVLFCDLKGFSRQAEAQSDNLIGLLDRVSLALDVMTRHILEHGGVIGDFQGDAAMGVWGWPVASPDDPLRACRAALAIRREFEQAARAPQHALARFESGMGLARGRAVAGKIGTRDHTKVTVFGPVVNLASRLEGMTRQLRVPIVVEESLARIAREGLSPREGRVRTLARVLPYGLETPALVSELLPGEAELPEFTAQHLTDYESAVERFLDGQWEEAYRLLRTMPSSDRAQDVLALQIARHNRVPPPDWNGVLRFEGK
jgi:adenylate cyclase